MEIHQDLDLAHLAINIMDRAGEQQQLYTLSRVPPYFRNTNEKLYEPRVISIGPYHRGSPHLQAMEKCKSRYLLDFLNRFNRGLHNEHILGECLTTINELDNEARRFYSENITLGRDEFAKMMLLDACFIIELAFKLSDKEDYTLGWGLDYLYLDLLLIENQIPFFIIRRLFDRVVSRDPHHPPLNCIIQSLYKMTNIFAKAPTEILPEIPPEIPTETHHLLHLYHLWFVHSVEPRTVPSRWRPRLRRVICLLFSWDIFLRFFWVISLPFSCYSSKMSSATAYVIPCATELLQAGVRFKKKRVPSHLLDITFQEGVMKIPFFSIDDTTKPLFINLIALEQSMFYGNWNMTSYCLLMDCLINTEKDVAILQRCNVIENLLGNEEEVARFFNQLCEYVCIRKGNYYSEMFKQVNHYRNFKWNRYRAKLCHDYLSNPWAIISLGAAILLLLLTLLQAIYAVKSYKHPPN